MVPFFKFAGRAEHRGREAEQGVRGWGAYNANRKKTQERSEVGPLVWG